MSSLIPREETLEKKTPPTSQRSVVFQRAVLEGGGETQIFPIPKAYEGARNFSRSQSLYGGGELGIFPSPSSV